MRIPTFLSASLLALTLAAAGCGGSDDSSPTTAADTSASTTAATTADCTPEQGSQTKPKVTVPKGKPPTKLVIKDITKGTCAAAADGDTLSVDYVGVSYSTGKQFDASWDRGQPFSFPLGAGQVIPGWDQGLKGMKAGGRRELIIPAKLAYGDQGAGDIKPGETLIFVVDLRSIN